MAIAIRPLQPFGGEVGGVDLGETSLPETIAAIEAGLDRHALLVFHDQFISDEQQVVFTANFGPLLKENNKMTRAEDRRLDAAFADVSNLDKGARLRSRDDKSRMSSLANRLWHSDGAFRVVPAKYSFLSGRAVPPSGGNTEIADMRAAYDALDAAMKAEVADLVCEHSLMTPRLELGFTQFTAEERASFAPVRQPLVRVHPVTGRKSLFLSAHAGGIVGWPVPEAKAFLRDLTEHATQPAFVCVHRWRAGDLIVWDNRQTMHRVRRFDDLTQVRDMRRTTVICDGPLAVQAA